MKAVKLPIKLLDRFEVNVRSLDAGDRCWQGTCDSSARVFSCMGSSLLCLGECSALITLKCDSFMRYTLFKTLGHQYRPSQYRWAKWPDAVAMICFRSPESLRDAGWISSADAGRDTLSYLPAFVDQSRSLESFAVVAGIILFIQNYSASVGGILFPPHCGLMHVLFSVQGGGQCPG